MPTTILGYKDIFQTSTNKSVINFINGIDPEFLILIISKISSLLFNGKNSLGIVRTLTSDETFAFFSTEYLAVIKMLTSKTKNEIFNEKSNSEFLKLIVNQYDTLNTTKANLDFKTLEIGFLYAYLLINEQTFDSAENVSFENIPGNHFQEFAQIILIKPSIQYQSKNDFFYELVKIKSLLHYYYINEKDILEKFYFKKSIKNPDIWVLEILNLLTKKDEYENYRFSVGREHWLFNYLEETSINHLFNSQISDTQLRLHSLLKNDEQFIIINWSFFLQHIFYKIYYDLYILHREKYPLVSSYNGYKSIVSEKVSEEIIFRNAIQKSFTRKSTFIKYDERKTNGMPDCYLRYGNNVLLFEFKDNAIGNDFINSDDFDFVKKYIDDRFVIDTRKKNKAIGINQLAKFIRYLDANHEFDSELFTKFKAHSISIYPILVVSDEMFSYPAVEQYLTNEFKKSKPNETKFVKIKDLIVINISTLIDYYLGSEKLDYFSIIREYSSKKKNYKMKGFFPKFPSIDNIYYKKKSKAPSLLNLIKEITICDIEIEEQLQRAKKQ